MERYIKIFICDDEKVILNNAISDIEEIIDNNGYKGIVEGSTDSNKLLKHIEEYNDYYDIYILDIDMEGINGIETARRIKDIQEDAIIIFFTSYDTWAMEAFDVQPFNYILKSSGRERLESVLVKSFKKFEEKKTLYYFKQGKNLISIPYKNIFFFESEKRKVKIKTRDLEYYYYDTLNEVQKKVREDLFIRVHISFLINMEYIKNFDGKNITLLNDEIIPVSQKYSYSFNIGYIKFLKKRC